MTDSSADPLRAGERTAGLREGAESTTLAVDALVSASGRGIEATDMVDGLAQERHSTTIHSGQ